MRIQPAKMKKRSNRWYQGHKCVIVKIGHWRGYNAIPSGGYDVSCECGWDGGNFSRRTPARDSYRAHIAKALSGIFSTCKRCGQRKPACEMRSDYKFMCLYCFSKLGNEWSKRNPDRSTEHKRKYQLMKFFGITIEEVYAMLKAQNHKCAICGGEIKYSIKNHPGTNAKAPHVDHNHITGSVRGLLCFKCNAGLGNFGDKIETLSAAIAYLKKHFSTKADLC
jgi:hypothetical protein